MHPNAEASVTQLSDFQNWLSAAKDEESSRNADWAGRSDSDPTLLSHLHSLLTSDDGQVFSALSDSLTIHDDLVVCSLQLRPRRPSFCAVTRFWHAAAISLA
jgi:hypothetical protein